MFAWNKPISISLVRASHASKKYVMVEMGREKVSESAPMIIPLSILADPVSPRAISAYLRESWIKSTASASFWAISDESWSISSSQRNIHSMNELETLSWFHSAFGNRLVEACQLRKNGFSGHEHAYRDVSKPKSQDFSALSFAGLEVLMVLSVVVRMSNRLTISGCGHEYLSSASSIYWQRDSRCGLAAEGQCSNIGCKLGRRKVFPRSWAKSFADPPRLPIVIIR